LELPPSRVFASSRLPAPRRRFDSQRSRVPSTTSLGLAPCEPECPDPARFRSQVFSTSQRFPSTPELCGLVACRCRPWDPSLQSFPLGEDRLPLSGLPAPLQSSTSVLRRAARRRSPPGFPDSYARAQLPGSPRDYGLPFRGPRSASWSSWAPLSGTASFRQLHLLRSFPPLAESVHGPIGLPRRHRSLLSWALLPLRSFPSCTSDPRPAWTRGPDMGPRPWTWAHDLEDRNPPGQVKPPQANESPGETSSAASSLLRGWTAPPLGGDSFPRGLGPSGRSPNTSDRSPIP
jgi:hypothetical protein